MRVKRPGRRVDSPQLRRQWVLLRLLASSGRSFTVKELAEQLRVNKSTIDRDLRTLAQLFPLVREPGGAQRRRYRLAQRDGAIDRARPLGPMHWAAIHAALSVLDPLAGTPLHDDLAEVAGAVRAFLADRDAGTLDRLARAFVPDSAGSVSYAGKGDVIDDLIDAIARGRVVRAMYRGRAESATRVMLRPLHLFWRGGALHVLGRVGARRGSLKILGVHRIDRTEVTKQSFRPPRVDPGALLASASGLEERPPAREVEVLFAASIAPSIEERVFHLGEIKVRLRDGRLRYRVRTDAREEIVNWVLRCGGEAEIVAPASWRQIVRDRAARLLAAHAAPRCAEPRPRWRRIRTTAADRAAVERGGAAAARRPNDAGGILSPGVWASTSTSTSSPSG